MQTDRTSKKITFKPLHDGVGFHPFSEGLPYAPQSTAINRPESKPRATAPSFNTDYQRGTGATSAGAPSFSMPKTTRQIQQQNTSQVSQKPVVNTKSITPAAASVPSVSMPATSILRKRFFAYLLDTVVHLGFWMVVNMIATIGFNFQVDYEILVGNWFGFGMFFIFSQWFFISMQEVLFENTIGKFFFGLEFKRNRQSFFSSSLFLRSIVFMMGILSAGIGLYFLPQDKIAEIQPRQT